MLGTRALPARVYVRLRQIFTPKRSPPLADSERSVVEGYVEQAGATELSNADEVVQIAVGLHVGTSLIGMNTA